jgi:predicted P-loop ATPase/GTPase
LKDEFAPEPEEVVEAVSTEEPIPEETTEPTTAMAEGAADDAILELEVEEEGMVEVYGDAAVPLRKVVNVQNLVPVTPDVISTGFGRPLETAETGIPPLRPQPKVASSAAKVTSDEEPYGE